MITDDGAVVIRPCRRASRGATHLMWGGVVFLVVAIVAAVVGEVVPAAILVAGGAMQVVAGRRARRARVEVSGGQVLIVDMWRRWTFEAEAVVGVAVDRRWVRYWAVAPDPLPPTFRPKHLIELILEDGTRRFPEALRRPAGDPETATLVEDLLGSLPNAERRRVA